MATPGATTQLLGNGVTLKIVILLCSMTSPAEKNGDYCNKRGKKDNCFAAKDNSSMYTPSKFIPKISVAILFVFLIVV